MNSKQNTITTDTYVRQCDGANLTDKRIIPRIYRTAIVVVPSTTRTDDNGLYCDRCHQPAPDPAAIVVPHIRTHPFIYKTTKPDINSLTIYGEIVRVAWIQLRHWCAVAGVKQTLTDTLNAIEIRRFAGVFHEQKRLRNKFLRFLTYLYWLPNLKIHRNPIVQFTRLRMRHNLLPSHAFNLGLNRHRLFSKQEWGERYDFFVS